MKRKLIFFTLLVTGVVAAQSCKWLFKSDYAELSATELTAYVDARYPETARSQIAQSEMVRKKFINDFKRSFALAQAAEEVGLHKSEEFKRRVEFGVEQLLAAKYNERNPDVIISKEELEAYYASHKDQFDDHVKFITANLKQPITDQQKEQQRLIWSQTKTGAEKARQAGLEKDSAVVILVKFGKADLLAGLYAQSLEEKHKLTDDERKKYLAEHPGADADKQKEKAQGLLERLKNGEKFEKIASEFSDDTVSKANGGDLGWFPRGRTDPAFEAVAFGLKKGQTSTELVKSRFGYHIIRVEDRRMSSPKPAASPAPIQAPGQSQEPREEVHARHILIDTTESEQFEARLIKDKVNRDLEDVALKYAVNAPTDFIVNGALSNPPGGPGGQGGSIREINPGEKK